MPYRVFWVRCVIILLVCLPVLTIGWPAAAADSYVTRYLRVTDSVPLTLDQQGNTRPFSAAELSAGKQLFERNCLSCHVGGATLPDPTVSLSLANLQGATPPRDTINSLVAFFRQPMSYDGSEEALFCRRVPESWLSQVQVENLAGFVLRAAQAAPGWGSEIGQDD